MSISPLGSNQSVSHSGGAASAAPRLVLSRLAVFGGGVGSTVSPKTQIRDRAKEEELKRKFQEFLNIVGDFFEIEGEVFGFYLDPDPGTEVKGFLKVRSNVLDPSHPLAPPKEVVQLVNIPLLALQLDDAQFKKLDEAYQDVCLAQLGRKAPNGLKKSFNRQLNTQSLESTPFLGSEMLKGEQVRDFLNLKTAQQMNALLPEKKSEKEIEKIQEQLEMTKGLVREGNVPAVLLALFDIDPARLRESFQDNEPEEKHWYSRLGLGKDTAELNRLMAFRMIDKIIAECQAFSLDPEVQQEASRFFAKKENLIISQKKYHPPGVYDLDILFHGKKKEWKTHEEWINHFNRFSLEDKEKLDLLNRLKEWRGEDYREKLAQEDNPSDKDTYYRTNNPPQDELDTFLNVTGLDLSDSSKADPLRAALTSSLKEGRTLKDLELNELIEKLGGHELAQKVQEAQKQARQLATQGLAPQPRQAPISANPPLAGIGLQPSRRGAPEPSLASRLQESPQNRQNAPEALGSAPQAGRVGQGVREAPQLGGQDSASSLASSPLSSRRPSIESLSSDASVAGVGMPVQRPSSFSGSSQPASRSSSPVSPQAPSPQLNQEQLQERYNWIQSIYDSLHQGEGLKKQDLQPLYGFDIGRDRSYLEDLFAQKRRLDPHLDGKRFIDSYSQAIGWAKSMLDNHLKNWIQAKDASFTDDAVNVLKSSPRIRPLLDALAQAYDPRVTTDIDQKTRTLGVLDRAKWDLNVLDHHKQGIEHLLREWDQHAIHSHQEAAPLKAEFLAKSHQNLQGELNAFNDRVQTNGNEFQYQQYEIETNFTGSPSFEDWAKRPENLYDAKVNGLHDSSLFKAALKKPEVKKAFLDRHEKIGDGDFDAKFQALTNRLLGQMGDYSPEKQAQFFEQFILSQKDRFYDWLQEKEDAVAKLALEEYTKNQSEVFKRVFEDEDFKEFIVRETRGPNFEDNQKRVFDRMNHFIRSQTDLLLAKATTIDAVAQELRDLAGLDDFWS